MVFAPVTSLIPEDKALIMVESILSAGNESYQFELTTVVCYSDGDNDSNESDIGVRE